MPPFPLCPWSRPGGNVLLPGDMSGNQLQEDSVLPLPICPCSRPGGKVLRSCDGKSGNPLPEDSAPPVPICPWLHGREQPVACCLLMTTNQATSFQRTASHRRKLAGRKWKNLHSLSMRVARQFSHCPRARSVSWQSKRRLIAFHCWSVGPSRNGTTQSATSRLRLGKAMVDTTRATHGTASQPTL